MMFIQTILENPLKWFALLDIDHPEWRHMCIMESQITDNSTVSSTDYSC